MISVVFPVFNERDNLVPLLDEIADALVGVEYEIVVVDDCSTDGSLDVLRSEAEQRGLTVVVNPGRLGQSAALMAGFGRARGETIVTLDGDGQNDPKDIPRLLDHYRNHDGPVAIVGVRTRRAASGWKRFQAMIANRTRDVITGDRVRDTGCALRVARRDDLIALPRFKGFHRFIPTLLRREGVIVHEIPVHDRERKHGASKYGMWNRVFGALVDALGVRWLLRRSFTVRTKGR